MAVLSTDTGLIAECVGAVPRQCPTFRQSKWLTESAEATAMDSNLLNTCIGTKTAWGHPGSFSSCILFWISSCNPVLYQCIRNGGRANDVHDSRKKLLSPILPYSATSCAGAPLLCPPDGFVLSICVARSIGP